MSRGTGRRDVQRKRRIVKRASLRVRYALRRELRMAPWSDRVYVFNPLYAAEFDRIWSLDEILARYPKNERDGWLP